MGCFELIKIEETDNTIYQIHCSEDGYHICDITQEEYELIESNDLSMYNLMNDGREIRSDKAEDIRYDE